MMRRVAALRRGGARGSERPAELRRIIGRAAIPAIPEVVTAAIEQVSAPDCDLRAVADTIGLDPGVSARLISVANCAAYAPRNPVVGVRQAVMMLGKNRLESLLISLAVTNSIGQIAAPGFDMRSFRHVAAWRGLAAGMLSRKVDRTRSNVNFSAALLADIAMPVLMAHDPRYSSVYTRWREGTRDLTELEAAALGWTRFDVAAWLFDEWGFPGPLRDAVASLGGHRAMPGTYPVVEVVLTLGRQPAAGDVVEATAHGMVATFGLDHEDAVALLGEARAEAAKLARQLA